MNLVVLNGVLAADPDHRTYDSGASALRCLITVRSDQPKRTDVVPVTYWDPPQDVINAIVGRGQPVWMAGMVQRRFSADADGRRGRIEIVARALELGDEAPATPGSAAGGSATASH